MSPRRIRQQFTTEDGDGGRFDFLFDSYDGGTVAEQLFAALVHFLMFFVVCVVPTFPFGGSPPKNAVVMAVVFTAGAVAYVKIAR